jgi:hypothetical protein
LVLSRIALTAAYADVVALLADARDIVFERAEGTAPWWAVERGWGDYLLGISEAALERADALGIARWFVSDPLCPPSLHALAGRSLAVTARIPSLPREAASVDFPFMNVRKRGEVAAILRLLREVFSDLSEIVDVGAGRGQLTTRAAAALSVPTLGLERDPQRVAVATALAGNLPVRFLTADVLSPTDNPLLSLPAKPDRLLMALHGCGELGDALIEAAVATRSSVLLLGCCPQKIRGQQRDALLVGGPSFPRKILGLANVLSRTEGIEGELRCALATKEARLALRYLLAARGFAGFAQAVCAVRGLPLPTPSELAAAATQAHAHYLAQRRLSLPRSMLGRPLEIFLALDRARYLESHGYGVHVVELFPVATSPRNLAVVGVVM